MDFLHTWIASRLDRSPDGLITLEKKYIATSRKIKFDVVFILKLTSPAALQ
jgi:hypothetical protein